MSHRVTNTVDSDISAFYQAPPPPYSGTDGTSQGAPDLTPMTQGQNRPRLPVDLRNPHLDALPEDTKIVKFQTIVREGKEIVVGRVKVPTPGANSHAFILRRYDTDAVSLTTMYKVAFPGASEEDERREMEWVRSAYDTRGTNGGRGTEMVRLAGQWISRHLATHLAPAYGLGDLITHLVRAVPDPNVAYRKSARSQIAHEELTRAREGGTGTTPAGRGVVPSMTEPSLGASPAPKRQRKSTPGTSAPTQSTDAPAGDDDDRHFTIEANTTITTRGGAPGNMDEEVEQARRLVADLKRELQLKSAAGDALEEIGGEVAEGSRGRKRSSRADEGVVISSGAGTAERIVRTNRRVQAGGVMGETAKKVAFSALVFGLGIGAATLIPQLLPAFF